MSQGATRPVEWVAIAVLAFLESDFNVHIARSGSELEICVFGPDAKGTGDFRVHIFLREFRGVFGDFVGEVLRLPTTPCFQRKYISVQTTVP